MLSKDCPFLNFSLTPKFPGSQNSCSVAIKSSIILQLNRIGPSPQLHVQNPSQLETLLAFTVAKPLILMKSADWMVHF